MRLQTGRRLNRPTKHGSIKPLQVHGQRPLLRPISLFSEMSSSGENNLKVLGYIRFSLLAKK